MSAANRTGLGTALTAEWNGAPALSVGVPMSVAISTQVSFRSTLVA